MRYGDQDLGGDDGLKEIEAAAKEDDDAEAAGRRKCDGRAADVEETQEKSSIASDGEEQEGTPE